MISIVTPVLNGAKFIESNIKSIAKLNIPFEHIIVDGGSSDQTLEIASKYSHVKILKQVDGMGMYSAIHQGFLNSKFDIITWINSDDSIIAENYDKAIKLITSSNIDLLYGDAFFLYTESNMKYYIKGNKFGQYFLLKGIMPFVQPSSIFRKSVYFNYPLNYSIFKICGDLDFFQRLSFDEKVKFEYYDVPLSIFLKHGASLGDLNISRYKLELLHLRQRPNLLHRILFKLASIL